MTKCKKCEFGKSHMKYRGQVIENGSMYAVRYRVFQKSLCAALSAAGFRGTRLAGDAHWTAQPTTVQIDH